MIVFGTRLFGKVDRIPQVGHVATRFFHLNFVPLIPNDSYLVFQQKGRQWRGAKIPLNSKSMLVAWGRLLSLIAGIGGTLFSIPAVLDHRNPLAVVVTILIAIGGWALFILSVTHKSVTQANCARACQLMRQAGLNEQLIASVAAQYGQAPPDLGFAPVMPPATGLTPPPLIAAVVPVQALPATDESSVDTVPADAEDAESRTAHSPRVEARRHG